MDAPKPTPLHKRILAAAALIAFVAILVMAVYPIYKSRRAGTNCGGGRAGNTDAAGREVFVGVVSAAGCAAAEGQAYVELTTAESR